MRFEEGRREEEDVISCTGGSGVGTSLLLRDRVDVTMMCTNLGRICRAPPRDTGIEGVQQRTVPLQPTIADRRPWLLFKCSRREDAEAPEVGG